MTRLTLGLCLAGALAVPAGAGVIATPALDPATGQRVACIVANVSDTKTVQITAAIYDFNGGAMWGPSDLSLLPNRNTRLEADDDAQGHCVVNVRNGGTKNVRVSLHVRAADGSTIAAVSGSR